MAQDTINLLVDSREKRPLLFPQTFSLWGRRRIIQVEQTKLDAGDYVVVGLENTTCCERKASLLEIRKNLLTTDLRRARAAFDRLAASCAFPILLLESSPQELMTPTVEVPRPGPLIQRLLDECTVRNMQLFLPGKCLYPAKRRMVGEILLRMMISFGVASGIKI